MRLRRRTSDDESLAEESPTPLEDLAPGGTIEMLGAACVEGDAVDAPPSDGAIGDCVMIPSLEFPAP